MTRLRRAFFLLPIFLLCGLAGLRSADAGFPRVKVAQPIPGQGPQEVDPRQRTIDITVLAEYLPPPLGVTSPDDPRLLAWREHIVKESEKWAPQFEAFSAMLYDATEGQLRLGKVTFTGDPSLGRRADVVISRVVPATPTDANTQGLVFGPGMSIQLDQKHRCDGSEMTLTLEGFTPPTCPGGEDDSGTPCEVACFVGERGQFGLLHEAGHYLFNLWDEYQGRICPSTGCVNPNLTKEEGNVVRTFFCAGNGTSKKACLMDGGSNQGLLAIRYAAEPFVDANRNGQYDLGETYTDYNGNDLRDGAGTVTLARNERSEFCIAPQEGVDPEGLFTHREGAAVIREKRTGQDDEPTSFETEIHYTEQAYQCEKERERAAVVPDGSSDCWTHISGADSPVRIEPLVGAPQEQSLAEDPTVVGRRMPTIEAVTGSPGYIFVLDTSVSMGKDADGEDVDVSLPRRQRRPTRLEMAIQGLDNALMGMDEAERVAILTFDGAVTEQRPFERLAYARDERVQERAAIADKLSKIEPGGYYTALGTAFEKAMRAYEDVAGLTPADLAGVTVILFTDGDYPGRRRILQSQERALDSNKVAVDTIAIGNDEKGEALLTSISRSTFGIFYDTDVTNLWAVAPRSVEAASGRATIQQTDETLTPTIAWRPGEEVLPAQAVVKRPFIPTGALDAKFAVTYEPGEIVQVTLVDPSGRRYFWDDETRSICVVTQGGTTPLCGEAGVPTLMYGGNEIVYLENASRQMWRVIGPQNGTWDLDVRNLGTEGTPGTVPGQPPRSLRALRGGNPSGALDGADIDANIQITAMLPEIRVTTSITSSRFPPGGGGAPPGGDGGDADGDGTFCFPEPIDFQVVVYALGGVTGVSVEGRVFYPGGAEATFELFDDGLAIHGDRIAGDGIYSERWAKYRSAGEGGGNGPHRFEITVKNENMQAYPIAHGGGGTGPAPGDRLVPEFSLQDSVTAVVRCVPDDPIDGTDLEIVLINPGLRSTPADPQQVRIYEANEVLNGAVLAFCVTGTPEYTDLKSVTISALPPLDPEATPDIDESTLGEFRLYADSNCNGIPDQEGSPLAIGSFATNNGTLTFDLVDGVSIPPGEERGYVVTAGLLRAEVLRGLGDAVALLPRPPPLPIWDWVLATLAAALVGSRVMANRRLARPIAVTCCMMLAFLLTGVVGCGSGGGSGECSPHRIFGGVGCEIIVDPETEKVVPGTYQFQLTREALSFTTKTSSVERSATAGEAITTTTIVQASNP